MYKISRIQINNFKSVSKLLDIDLSTIDTAIFDGPNGFGKTTLFDAIEISFTGSIKRINSATGASDSKAKNNHLLKNSIKHETKIILELVSSNEKGEKQHISIQTIIPANISGVRASVRNYKSNINRHYKLTKDDHSPWLVLDQKTIEELIDFTSLTTLFHIQHYIQQEETAGFLKNHNEQTRHDTLSHLFGTTAESEELKKINLLKKVIDDRAKTLKTELVIIERKLNTLSLPITIQEQTTLPSGKIPSLLQFIKSTLSPDDFLSKLDQLKTLLYITKNNDIFASIKKNHQINYLLTNRSQQLNDLLRLAVVEKYTLIEKIHNTSKKQIKLKNKVSILQEIIDKANDDDNALANDFLDLIARHFTPSIVIEQSIEALKQQRLQIKGLNATLTKIITNRTNLMESFKTFHQEHTEEDVKCPLCGTLKVLGITELIQDYNSHQKILNEQVSAETTGVLTLEKRIFDDYISQTINKCKNLVRKYSAYCTKAADDFFAQKAIDVERFAKLKKVQAWLDGQNIMYHPLTDPIFLHSSTNYSDREIELSDLLRRQIKVIPDDAPTLEDIKQALRKLNLTDDDLPNISPKDINIDVNFISDEEKKHSNHTYKNTHNEHTKTIQKIKNLENESSAIKKIQTVYKAEIQKHESNIAAQIAIPFYIYSSKILQTRPEGTGILLRTLDTSSLGSVPYIRFCSNRFDDHDAWYTMSSGQLSGLIISFALSMNKIYPSKLKTILIDDPMQSMDEINMASFIQLLKYEFDAHQLILSTHDSRISSYINYKVQRSGKTSARFNLKTLSKGFN